MWIERSARSKLLEAAAYFPVVYLGGPRQAGKTSLMRRTWPGAAELSLDRPALAELAELSPATLLGDLAGTVFIDEAQYAPSLFRHLKILVDADRRPGRFLLTGSQDLRLMQAVSESLAGRCAILTLHTLSGTELVHAGLVEHPNLLGALVRGGFPELWKQPDLPWDLWYSSYVATYLERDVRNALGVQSLRDFERFLRALAARSGNLLSYSELARDVGISVPTARSWLSVLQATHQAFVLEPYHLSLGKRLVKTPKVFLADSGLACFLCGIRSPKDLVASPQAGALWETWVAGQLVRELGGLGGPRPLWFWRTSAGAEVDFVIEEGGRYHLLEARLAEAPESRPPRGFAAFARMYGDDAVASRTVVCRTSIAHPIPGGGWSVPGSADILSALER